MSSIDDLSDAELIAAVASVVRTPRADPADSFVLHAPLELAARAALLPRVAPGERTQGACADRRDRDGVRGLRPGDASPARPSRSTRSLPRRPVSLTRSRPEISTRSTQSRLGSAATSEMTSWHPFWPMRSCQASPPRRTARSSCSRCRGSRLAASSRESSSGRSLARSPGTRTGSCGGSWSATVWRLPLRMRCSRRFRRRRGSVSPAATSSTR